jgi:hypothetical protein
MSADQPLLVRTPAPPIEVRPANPLDDLAKLKRVLDRLKALPCQN